mgnify:CR=1 FL=1
MGEWRTPTSAHWSWGRTTRKMWRLLRCELARWRRPHLCNVAAAREQELPRRCLGAGHRPARSRQRQCCVRTHHRLPERFVGHQLHLQTHRPRLRSVARLRPAPCGAAIQRTGEQSHAIGTWPAAATVSSVPAVSGYGPLRQLGELPGFHRSSELAVPQRRSRGDQCESDRRASPGDVCDLRSRHPSRCLPLEALPN